MNLSESFSDLFKLSFHYDKENSLKVFLFRQNVSVQSKIRDILAMLNYFHQI